MGLFWRYFSFCHLKNSTGKKRNIDVERILFKKHRLDMADRSFIKILSKIVSSLTWDLTICKIFLIKPVFRKRKSLSYFLFLFLKMFSHSFLIFFTTLINHFSHCLKDVAYTNTLSYWIFYFALLFAHKFRSILNRHHSVTSKQGSIINEIIF